MPFANPTEAFKFPVECKSFTDVIEKNFIPAAAERRALIKLCGNIRHREIHEFSYPGLCANSKFHRAFPVTQLNRQKRLHTDIAPLVRRQLGS